LRLSQSNNIIGSGGQVEVWICTKITNLVQVNQRNIHRNFILIWSSGFREYVIVPLRWWTQSDDSNLHHHHLHQMTLKLMI